VEAAKWSGALETLGFEVTTIAGAGLAEIILPGIAMHAEDPPLRVEIEDALCRADLVVVENLCSLPLNPPAAAVVADVLRGRRSLLHHHDLPWQREQFAGFPAPSDDPAWAHVTINQISRRQLASRGITASVLRNTFDVHVPRGDRRATRDSMGVDEKEVLVLQPTRAIPRKNIACGISLSESLGATYWLLGPAEDGFGPVLEKLVAGARCRVLLGHGPKGPMSVEDAYAACDVVALPSTWEGFGNPAVESAVHGKPLAIGTYPVAAELASFGFRWFAADDPRALAGWLEDPDEAWAAHNRSVAAKHFSETDLPERIGRVIDEAGWSSW